MNVWHYAMNQLMSDIAQKMKVKTSRNSNKKKTQLLIGHDLSKICRELASYPLKYS